MVLENIVHKGSTKFHKTDEKITHFALQIPPSIFEFFIFPLHASPFQKFSGLYK